MSCMQRDHRIGNARLAAQKAAVARQIESGFLTFSFCGNFSKPLLVGFQGKPKREPTVVVFFP